MKKYILLIALLFIAANSFAQDDITINGVVMNDANDKFLENVNIVNLNQVKGTITNEKGEFAIKAAVNDTLFFSYLGFKSIRVRVTNDWLRFGDIKVKMTELGIALEEVVIRPIQLTGYVEIDAKLIPIFNLNVLILTKYLINAAIPKTSFAQQMICKFWTQLVDVMKSIRF